MRGNVLGRHIREERKRRGMTVGQLAAVLGVSDKTVGRLEDGNLTDAERRSSELARNVTEWLQISPQQAWQEYITDIADAEAHAAKEKSKPHQITMEELLLSGTELT